MEIHVYKRGRASEGRKCLKGGMGLGGRMPQRKHERLGGMQAFGETRASRGRMRLENVCVWWIVLKVKT
jgi:hypothetical protein